MSGSTPDYGGASTSVPSSAAVDPKWTIQRFFATDYPGGKMTVPTASLARGYVFVDADGTIWQYNGNGSTNVSGDWSNEIDVATAAELATETAARIAADALLAPINNPTFTGTVGGISKSMVGLGNVDNTSDVNKPVSTAQAAADAAVQAFSIQRANHTGTQLASTISDFSATVVATVLTGLSTASSVVITASDTVLSALGKLQAQITTTNTNVTANTASIATNTTNIATNTAALLSPPVNAQTGTTYTVASSDAGKVVTLSNASAITVTLSGLSDGNQIMFEQKGAGQITFVTGTLTLRHVASLTKTAGQYARVFGRVDGTDFILCGDMA